ncbi:bifunctional proline dehydrogenase/L-glutamate gamma-semialdehyde dehydrogenase [Arthrobacter sp. TES]|jgi:RHH-type proline utilization regulon transcriptional repressor/proline dehydrogenase/delta 1-pyrroline-5-carboxylate dehydrogenase|uniref:bifunctional proline dehydrogenase/L-glutamate gamma-semialdehyde dehydrogenase n=1 Tax=Paenarthrobacter ureafaciens TaxID=37931 RepID=UPI000396E2D4|nr:bifunctional proline dehydrogenase/L-glutamate gamma-semialdehyde dehydrogenase [Paenarthrobacter ureafaciens]AOY72825.1 1-pyrroline-5-carboxylate dehydrogenase [Arthrobacter sp. ZXY-2]QOI64444.1 bifunctional proline dehydrogenase/L-glutamate gamma-semialdehyde dehydrogenase [Arthrobacter sp. TES]GLU59039.1 1-pyrroline-5-carboxylate dehydrogenase [Paenarthrobacter ureafaciens]GLU63306.1 1-pyrroline-5-carboxylate dehydrogenase [Paenarthrobacter ureafaciens]GLU67581.1 1-pyrroline-5-carboxylat
MTSTLPDATSPRTQDSGQFDALAHEAIALVRHWLTEAAKIPVDVSAQRLAGVLKDPNGLEFTVGFVDGVIRPEDLSVAGRKLAELAPKVPTFLPWYMRGAVRVGGIMAPIMPQVVIPIARRVLREMVGHLIVDATDAKLGPAIAKIKQDGVHLNVNLLGEAVLGEHEAQRRLDGTLKLLAREDVDYVSIKESSTVAPHSPWAFDEAVDHVVEKLTPLYRLAASFPKPKFINLDMEEYKDLSMTIAVFKRILDMPEFLNLEAGIVLQAYLPDALGAMQELQEWAAARRARGGAPIKVRVVKGANLPMEQVEASLHDWPLATWGSKQDSDTSYKSVINYALTPEHIDAVRIGVAGHNLFDVAFAWLLAKQRGVTEGIEFEMLLGMATGQATAVRKDVGSLLLYTPVVHPGEFDVAIAYLIRRLEEGASQENFMSAVFELSDNEPLFEREKQRFLNSLANLSEDVPEPNRKQDRRLPAEPAPTEGFRNTPDTDPALPANRAWGRDILARIPGSTAGNAIVESTKVSDAAELERIIAAALEAGKAWGARPAAERAAILHRAGDILESRRAELLEVMASETGKTLDQGDPEVSEAIDFAHYYAERAKDLEAVDGATFVPANLTVVTPPWNFPVAIPAGSTLAALASGSAVVIKPAKQARRSGSVMVDALWEAGVPRELLALVQLEERELGTQLVSHPSVDRVILTGGYETAELFRSFRQDLPLLAETSGKNAIIVTPSADLDLAAKDVVYSAFGHAGQKCSAASLVILVGSVAKSQRFHNQLIDAARSLTVGYPDNATTQMGPIIEPANGKLLNALTTLGEGETWAVKPERLDGTGRLWSPGIRSGVKRGSYFHLTEFFGPVLGVMTAETLEQAIAIQNEIEYGLTAGLHSLDSAEIGTWLETIQAGNLYVNRGITGAIVQRQPFGGWKKSAVGAGTKAGGPNYLIGLGNWVPAEAHAKRGTVLQGAAAEILAAAKSVDVTGEELRVLEQSLFSDADAWASEFGTRKDVSALTAERNVFRYRPIPVTIRLSEGERIADLLRVVAAGAVAGSALKVSSAVVLPDAVVSVFANLNVSVRIEDDAAWLARAATFDGGRIRLIGGDFTALSAATGGRPDIAVYHGAVTQAGRIEMLPFLREQAVSITAHRFGTPNHLSDGLI